MNESAARNAVHADVDALIAFWSLDGRIVRTIISGWDGWRANLYRLAVEPGPAGARARADTAGDAEDRLRRLDAERFCAIVLEENALGQALWRSAGYRARADWRRWVKPA